MNNQQEIIIPPPLAFRDTSVFVKCNPKNIDIEKELKRWYKIVVKDKHIFPPSLFGRVRFVSSTGYPDKPKFFPIKSINNLHLMSYENQYCGYRKGIDRCGVEVFYIRAGRKSKDGKTMAYCNVKNNGEHTEKHVGVKELKQYCKDNGLKGYSKCTKQELVKLLMTI